MFKCITVKNFRCFEEISIDNIERVNLIGGINNVGKTALLEAIFLLTSLNSIENPLKLNFNRGIFQQQTFDVEEICEWLFYQKQVSKVIKIKIVNDNNEESELKLSLDKASSPRLFPLSLKSNNRKTLKDLKVKFKKADGEPFVFTIFFTADREDQNQIRLAIQQDKEQEAREIEVFPPSIFLSSRLRVSPTEDAEIFSQFEAINQQNEIIEILKIIEPRLKRLAVLVTGGVPMIYGDIGADYLIPVSLMGEGMGRLLSIILSIMNAKEGTVLIDEIENGIHYSVMEKVWQSIAVATRKSNTQLFATTHSYECIRAAHQAFSNSELYDFRYFRLEREKETNIIKSLVYDKDNIETSLELNLEMR
ncbi:MAG: AAA family ATPase [Okeania sp. SIO2G4]|uniref:AAA family ATPase n=1 Tax=unclassified Okeania TaxID=2634635 RepID=UPI0013B5E518|nr:MULTISPECIES: ATP-binding protein [unclassified Okeania]NEP38674.1 AAA family ATPase [Okeania sp. SIO2H7]NEP70860.1 AAA family ATPase [Okeania sp. SIO2G5]NEP92361.1 AAA family ATPase [Okeania sp. SIO2F5]NEQ89911.1 AAA family ATPase [Okeania sp. SIO2G4]